MFADVESVLSYVYRVDDMSAYPESPLAAWSHDAESIRRVSSGLTRLDHVTQAAMMMSLIKESVSALELAALDVKFIKSDDAERVKRLSMSAVVLVERFQTHSSLSRTSEYLISETLRWGCAGRRFRRIEGGAQVSQRAWARREGVHPRTLRNGNKELHRFLNTHLQSAFDALDLPFCDAKLLGGE